MVNGNGEEERIQIGMSVEHIGEARAIFWIEPYSAVGRVHHDSPSGSSVPRESITGAGDCGKRVSSFGRRCREQGKHLGGKHDICKPNGRWITVDPFDEVRQTR